jgi:hypothetical protein
MAHHTPGTARPLIRAILIQKGRPREGGASDFEDAFNWSVRRRSSSTFVSVSIRFKRSSSTRSCVTAEGCVWTCGRDRRAATRRDTAPMESADGTCSTQLLAPAALLSCCGQSR